VHRKGFKVTAATPPNQSDDRFTRIEQVLKASETRIEARMEAYETRSEDRLEAIDKKLKTLSDKVERSNDKFDDYQKVTQWLLQMAFTLIAIATITIIISSVLSR
jgi:molecular chaperone GrpE (heat shock protein)